MHRILGKDYDYKFMHQSTVNWEHYMARHEKVAVERYSDDKSLLFIVTRSFLNPEKIYVKEYKEKALERPFNCQYGFHKVRLGEDNALTVLKSSFISCTEQELEEYLMPKCRFFSLRLIGKYFYLNELERTLFVIDAETVAIQESCSKEDGTFALSAIYDSVSVSRDARNLFVSANNETHCIQELFAEQPGVSFYEEDDVKLFSVFLSDRFAQEQFSGFGFKIFLYKEGNPVPFAVKDEDDEEVMVFNDEHDKEEIEIFQYSLNGTKIEALNTLKRIELPHKIDYVEDVRFYALSKTTFLIRTHKLIFTIDLSKEENQVFFAEYNRDFPFRESLDSLMFQKVDQVEKKVFSVLSADGIKEIKLTSELHSLIGESYPNNAYFMNSCLFLKENLFLCQERDPEVKDALQVEVRDFERNRSLGKTCLIRPQIPVRVGPWVAINNFPATVEVFHLMLPGLLLFIELEHRFYCFCINENSSRFENSDHALRFLVEREGGELAALQAQLSTAALFSQDPQPLPRAAKFEKGGEVEPFRKSIDVPLWAELQFNPKLFVFSADRRSLFDQEKGAVEDQALSCSSVLPILKAFTVDTHEIVQQQSEITAVSNDNYQSHHLIQNRIYYTRHHKKEEKLVKLKKNSKDSVSGVFALSETANCLFMNGRQELLFDSAEEAQQMEESLALRGEKADIRLARGHNLVIAVKQTLSLKVLEVKRLFNSNLFSFKQKYKDVNGDIKETDSLGVESACLLKIQEQQLVLVKLSEKSKEEEQKRFGAIFDTNLKLKGTIEFSSLPEFEKDCVLGSDGNSHTFFTASKDKIQRFKLEVSDLHIFNLKFEQGIDISQLLQEARYYKIEIDILQNSVKVQKISRNNSAYEYKPLGDAVCANLDLTQVQKETEIQVQGLKYLYRVQEKTRILKIKGKEETKMFETQKEILKIYCFFEEKKETLLVHLEGGLVALIDTERNLGVNCFEAEECKVVHYKNQLLVFDGKYLIQAFTGAKLSQFQGLELKVSDNSILSDDGRILVNKESVVLMHQPFFQELVIERTKERMKQQLSFSLDSHGLCLPKSQVERNTLDILRKEKNFFKDFVFYFIEHQQPEDFGILNLLFSEARFTELNLFHEAVSQDKILADNFLKLLTVGQEAQSFQSFVFRNIQDFKKIMSLPSFLEFLDSCIQPVKTSESLIQAAWNLEEDVVFISTSSFDVPKDYRKHFDANWREEKINHKKDEQEEQQLQGNEQEVQEPQADELEGTQNVVIEILELDFLADEKNIIELYKTLAEVDKDKIFASPAIEAIVNKGWEYQYPRVIKWIFLPYIVYALCFISYLIFGFDLKEVLGGVNYAPEPSILGWTTLPFSAVYSIVQLVLEFKQMKEDPEKYFFSGGTIWNFLDLGSSILVLLFSIVVMFSLDIGRSILIVGSLASFFIWIKLFYFLRIFRPTSSFIRMIVEMIKDIRVFLLIFFIGVFAFANFYFIMDKTNKEKIIGFQNGSYIDAVIYTYMQSLGELGYDNFEDSEYASLYWSVFFLSTVLMTITLLNLLIAIMGDTYDRVQEVAKEAQLKEHCAFLDEYEHLFPVEEFKKQPYIIIVRPESAESEGGDQWEGKIGALKSFFKKTMQAQDEKAIKQRKVLEEKMAQLKSQMDQQEIKQEQTMRKQEKVLEKQEEARKEVKQDIFDLKTMLEKILKAQ